MNFGAKSWSEMVVRRRYANFIYGVIKEYLCNERVVHVHYISIDDLVITTPMKNDIDIAALWSCSDRPGTSRVGAICRFAAEPLHG